MRRQPITKARQLWKAGRHLALHSLAAIAALAAAPAPAAPAWEALAPAAAPAVPEPAREFRGVWIATVYNLDWPSRPGLPVDAQKAELLEILDRAAALRLNAIVLQVRTMCDAFYDSPLEPWSYYLTGELGRAPDPWWDPLAWAIEAAHARGLELHAWFNPFRATTAVYGRVMPDHHISVQIPWVTRKSGTHLWLDPSSEFVRARAVTVVHDVVRRYEVDAVHMDDYFYPYPPPGSPPGIDDEENWLRYRYGEGLAAEGGPLDRDDWRRELVNGLIEELYRAVKATKPWVKVGLSPFGIWRPGHPEGIRGMDAYNHIFADSRKWLREGWVDYFSPQLYWKLEGPQSFNALYRWWQGENLHGRHIWPGVASSRIGSGGEGDGRGLAEIFGQIDATRAYRGQAPGSGQLHWRWEAFATNRGGVAASIAAQRYADRALVPPSPWLAGAEPPRLPAADALEAAGAAGKWRLDWQPGGGDLEAARWWVVQAGRRSGDSWTWRTERVLPGRQRHLLLDGIDGIDAFAVRAVGRAGELGEARVLARRD